MPLMHLVGWWLYTLYILKLHLSPEKGDNIIAKKNYTKYFNKNYIKI